MFIPKSQNFGTPNIGKNVKMVGPVNFGSEPYLITIGDDTVISFDCAFVTHDGGIGVVKRYYHDDNVSFFGPIKIGKNCFIGCRSVILPNVTIGDNCIIGAGSIVNRDIPPNTVAAGVPCKPICTLDKYYKKHKEKGDLIYFQKDLTIDQRRNVLLNHFSKK
jgi:acetyltransferase-like isoleucine patch superfamily enzyme